MPRLRPRRIVPSGFHPSELRSPLSPIDTTCMEASRGVVDHGRLFALTVKAMNVLDTDFWIDPYPKFARLRAEAPLLWNDDAQLWTIARHDDVMRISRDPTTFCSRQGV